LTVYLPGDASGTCTKADTETHKVRKVFVKIIDS